MNRVDGMEALDAVENGMIKLGQSRDIWQNDVVYAALAGVRLLLLDALKERHEPPIKDTLVRCKDCKHWSNHKPGEFVCKDCTLLGVPTYWRDYCSCGEEMSR